MRGLYVLILLAIPIGLGHYYYLSCDTNSMYPITCHDNLTAYHVKPYNLTNGTIIWYSITPEMRLKYTDYNFKGIGWIMHRIVEVKGTGYNKTYITRGDNNSYNDPWIVKPYQIRFKVYV